MKKTLLIVLISIAIPIYSWNIYQILGSYWQSPSKTKKTSLQSDTQPINLTLSSIQPVSFVIKGKNPFEAYTVKPKPVIKKKKKALVKKRPLKPKKEIKPPNIKITGIMWNPSNPIAMLQLPDGSSTTARTGQLLPGSIKVVNIAQNEITVLYEGNQFDIKR